MKSTMLNGLVMLSVLGATQVAWAGDARLPLRVLYLGRDNDDQRTTSFNDFLSDRFEGCVTAKRGDFESRLLDGVDVVIVDWSQQERESGKYKSPIGPLEEWRTPTVFLGSAGLLMAGPWSVIGGAG